MGKLIDLKGLTFGKLTVIERAENKGHHIYWKCKCTCGAEIVVRGDCLRKGSSTSCDCSRTDLVGQKFHRLTVLERADIKKGRTYYRCRCDCGAERFVEASNLVSGRVKSCGCFIREYFTKHGMEGTPIYNIWHSMKMRCHNPNCKNYKYYGGRGITICDEWLKFQNFYNDVSQLEHFDEPGYSLDRIDVNGNYELNNVRWATAKTQGRNRRTNRTVEYNGEQMTLIEAAEKSGINYVVLKNRIRQGDRGERLFRPVGVDNIIVEYEGESMCLADAAEKSNINRDTLKSRYYRGDRGNKLFRPVKRS